MENHYLCEITQKVIFVILREKHSFPIRVVIFIVSLKVPFSALNVNKFLYLLQKLS